MKFPPCAEEMRAMDLAFFQHPPKCTGVHIASHKKLEGVDALIKKQFIAAQYLDPRSLCFLYEGRVNRRVDGVENPIPAFDWNAAEGIAAIADHSQGRTID
jgi:hypothetical protein